MKYECLNKMIFFGEKSLRRALSEFSILCHAERNHQGLENNLIEPDGEAGCAEGDVQCRDCLSGMLYYYYYYYAA
jgi:hypothetical protein